MAQTLGQTAVGTIVKINENESPADFIVVQQGNPNPSIYSTTFNNGTWLLRREIVDPGQIISGGAWYKGYVPSSYINRLPSDILDKVIEVKQPYYSLSAVQPTLYTLENGRTTKFFINGPAEIGLAAPTSTIGIAASDGSRLAYFMSASASVSPNFVNDGRGTQTNEYWLRGYGYDYPGTIRYYIRNGAISGTMIDTPRNTSSTYASYRPCFLLPQNLTVLDDGTISIAAVPPVSCTFYNLVVMQGQPVTINWTASANGTSYILQRKSSADTDWVQVYSGSDLTFTETVGSNWTSVQYQVAAVMDGNASAYTQSVVHDVVSTEGLVISGEDGNLGTITSDVSYSITSDTGNQISITRKVNDIEVYSGTVSTGFTYDIPIVDLPTGADNTIEINASVQSTGGTAITQTRTWTYTKTPIAFSSSGGVSELRENDGAIWPATIQEAVRTYDFMGGTLDQAMMRLSNAVIKDPVTGGLVGFEGQDIGAAQIYVGSYVGTGTYGASNPTTITVPFTPIAIMICLTTEEQAIFDDNHAHAFTHSIRPSNKFKFYYQYRSTSSYRWMVAAIEWGDNSISFTDNNGAYFNVNGVQYSYVIFGGTYQE